MTDEIHFLKIESYSDHPEVVRAAELLVQSLMEARKRKRNEKLYLRDAKKLIASLWCKGEDDLFRFTTKTTYFSSSNRKQVWLTSRTLKLFNQMRELGWVNLVREAIPPSKSTKAKGGMAAIYCRSLTFKDLLKTLTVMDIIPNPDMPRVELRDEDRILKELPSAYVESESYKETVTILEDHYELLKTAQPRFSDGTLVPLQLLYYVRKFRPDLGHGGRLYAGFQQLSKRERLGITIKGESVISLDISQLHPALILRLKHNADKERDGLLYEAQAEVYSMPDYPDLPRAVHKQLINTLINAKSKDSAVRSLMNTHYWYDIFTDEWVVKSYKGKAKREGAKVFPDQPKIEAMNYLNSFIFHHPMMAEAVCSGIGSTLQLIDGQIMETILKVATGAGVPVLVIHDEIIVQEKYQSFIEMVLQRVFQATLKDKGCFGSITVKCMNMDAEESLILDLAS
jgi:hypothetical protein